MTRVANGYNYKSAAATAAVAAAAASLFNLRENKARICIIKIYFLPVCLFVNRVARERPDF